MLRKLAIIIDKKIKLDMAHTIWYIGCMETTEHSDKATGEGETMTSSETTMHPWERGGHGKAPFHFDGVTENVIEHGGLAGGHQQPGGTCDACSNGIRYEFWIVSSDGVRFKVGSDCVNKLSRLDNAKRDPLIVAVNDARRKLERDARHKREAKRIEAGVALFEANRVVFEAIPHWSPTGRDKGETMADAVDWMFAHAGNAGTIKQIKYVERVLTEKGITT